MIYSNVDGRSQEEKFICYRAFTKEDQAHHLFLTQNAVNSSILKAWNRGY